jgi:hypothetical protein
MESTKAKEDLLRDAPSTALLAPEESSVGVSKCSTKLRRKRTEARAGETTSQSSLQSSAERIEG